MTAPLDALRERLHTAAAALGWSVEDNPPLMTKTTLPGGGSKAHVPVAAGAADGPAEAMFVGPHAAVLLGSLDPVPLTGSRRGSQTNPPLDDNAVRGRWEAFQHRAAVVRSWVAQDRHDELLLMLAGPPGSAFSPSWQALAAEVERHDLVCRKLVWLPPVRRSNWAASLDDFLARTFLTRPWRRPVTPGFAPALDGASGASAILGRWESVLESAPRDGDSVDYRALVEKLIAAFPP